MSDLLMSHAATARVPIHADPDYPPMLREMAEAIQRELVEVGIDTDRASAVAETVTEQIRETFGGTPVYMGKGETMRQRRRRMQIWEHFTGANHHELAREFGMSLSQIYRVLAVTRLEMRRRQQPDLFGDDAGARAD